MASISLPDFILRDIFEFLSEMDLRNCAGVCRRWREIIYGHMYRTVTIVRDLNKHELRLDSWNHDWRLCVSPMLNPEDNSWKWMPAFFRQPRNLELQSAYITKANQDGIYRRGEMQGLVAPKMHPRKKWPDMPQLQQYHRMHIAPVLRSLRHHCRLLNSRTYRRKYTIDEKETFNLEGKSGFQHRNHQRKRLCKGSVFHGDR